VEKAYQWDSIVVLKGAHTVVAVPDGEIFVNPTGNPVLSTAGSGDVLTGLIAALLCGGLSAKWAAICGVYLHGLAGDLLLGQNGARGHLAGDLLAFIPRAFNSAFCRRPPSLDMPYPIKDDLLK
jgi:NAD(P)H-hydrate epimerase